MNDYIYFVVIESYYDAKRYFDDLDDAERFLKNNISILIVDAINSDWSDDSFKVSVYKKIKGAPDSEGEFVHRHFYNVLSARDAAEFLKQNSALLTEKGLPLLFEKLNRRFLCCYAEERVRRIFQKAGVNI